LAQLNWSFVAGPSAYSVTYNGNTSTSGAVPSDTGSYSLSAVVTVASNSGTLAKTGYTFDGWCTTQSAAGAVCSGTSQAEASTFTITGDTTLYAQWTGNVLTVTTDEQGGSPIDNASTTSGASMSDPGTPTLAGYEFAGWFDVSTGGSRISFPYAHGEIADFTLYAQWTAPAAWHVGETGPGGGTIFYVDMRRPAGSQYFEAACAGWQNYCDGTTPDPETQWGCKTSLISGADGTAIGTGEQNTADILAGCATSGIAARLADAYSYSGESDWFLPSKDELNQMYVEKIRIPGFTFGNYYYLSSSEYDADFHWHQTFFGNGDQAYFWKNYSSNLLRPVRSF